MKFPMLHRSDFCSEGTMEISQPRSGRKILAKKFSPERTADFESFQRPAGTQKNLWATFQPLRGWLISGGRSATPLALAMTIFLFAIGANATMANELSNAEIAGRNLVQQILELRPTTNFTQTGVLKIRDGNGNRTNVSMTCEVLVGLTDWKSIYTSSAMNPWEEKLLIVHTVNSTNAYVHYRSSVGSGSRATLPMAATSPFANSDFWLGDLGLEFFHWPQQKILKKEFRRSCGCMVLESVNPNPTTNGYSRVVTWIDEESFGIVQAEAYDSKNKLLKQFYPKDIKKVKGQWQVQTMDISNVQTGSRTRIEFHLESH
jgi:hypothetical protein